MAFVALAAVAILPSAADAVDGEPYTSITGDTHILKVSGSGDYTILFSYAEYSELEDATISFTAKLVDNHGDTQSSAVSPSSGEVDNDVGKVLTVTAPSSTGSYKLEVEFTLTYTNEDDEEEKETYSPDSYSIKVVNPIVLTQTLKLQADSKVDPSGLGVYFYVDGEKIADSYTTFDVSSQGTATVSYNWVADPSDGKHTFKVLPASGEEVEFITGLGEEHTFYVGDSSYTAIIALAVLLVVLMIVFMIWVYRKPVKNFGKPKSRR